MRCSGVRQWLEEREESLSPYAVKSRDSRGRLRDEPPSMVRTAFQRDRDRIIHCKAFRRLKHKTQVFIAPLGDHYVTRLTHTLEVSQIARTISRALNLNEDLTEAIALGHDLGHTPFGHMGEEVLNELSPFGFRHNEQSLRVVDLLEHDGKGLNLTFEVREGILKHSKTRVKILGEGWGTVSTLEGQMCKIADSVAYINHDIGDAIRAGMITERDLPQGAIEVLGQSHSERIDAMVCDIIENSWQARGAMDTPIDSCQPSAISISMSPEIQHATNALREFLFERVYDSALLEKEAEPTRQVLYHLYEYFMEHRDKLPREYLIHADTIERSVVDYISGMTDQYAFGMAESI